MAETTAISEDEIAQLKANCTVFIMKLSQAGGWTDLQRQSTLGIGEEAKFRAEADEILGRCMKFGGTLLAQFRWADAKLFYQLALKIDPTLDEAMRGNEKACDNAILNNGEDEASVVVYTRVHEAEVADDGKNRFYTVEVFDKRKVSATHAINEPVSVVKRRYSHFDKLRKRLIKEFGKPVASLDFPKKTVSVKGTSIGKKSKGAEEERRALFNTWLNGVLLMPDVLEFQEMKVWLGLEKATKGSKFASLEDDDDLDRAAGGDKSAQEAAQKEVERLKTAIADKRSFGVEPSAEEMQALMDAQMKAAGLHEDALGMPPTGPSPKPSDVAGGLTPSGDEAAVSADSPGALEPEPEPEPEPATDSRPVGKLEGKHLYGSVNDVVLMTPNMLVSCGDDKTLHLWDLDKRDKIAHIENDRIIRVLARVSDTVVASGNADNSVKLWNVSTTEEELKWSKRARQMSILTGHTGEVVALCTVTDTVIASGSLDKMIKLWDIETGESSLQLEGHEDVVHALAVVSPGVLASSSGDSTIRLWSIDGEDKGACTRTLDGGGQPVLALCRISDTQFASGAADMTARVWDLSQDHSHPVVATFRSHTSSITAMTVLQRGSGDDAGGESTATILVTGSADMTIKLWDLSTHKLLGTFGGPMADSGINYTVTGLAPIDQNSFASCADLVKRWTLSTSK